MNEKCNGGNLFQFVGRRRRTSEGGFAGDGIAGRGAQRTHQTAGLDAGRSRGSVALDGLARHLQFSIESFAAHVAVLQVADVEDVARALQ